MVDLKRKGMGVFPFFVYIFLRFFFKNVAQKNEKKTLGHFTAAGACFRPSSAPPLLLLLLLLLLRPFIRWPLHSTGIYSPLSFPLFLFFFTTVVPCFFFFFLAVDFSIFSFLLTQKKVKNVQISTERTEARASFKKNV